MKNKMHYLKMFHEGLTPELIKKAEAELGETEEIRIRSLQELKELIQGESDFYPCMEDVFLLRFLRVRKFNVNRAFKTLKNYYVFQYRNSGVFTAIKPSEIESVIRKGHSTWLEYRDQNYGGVGYVRFGMYDTDEVTMDQLSAFGIIITDIGIKMEATQISGFSMIMDFTGLTLKKALFYAAPTRMYAFYRAIENSLPIRIKGYHVINQPLYFDIIYGLARKFISKKMQKRVHLHGTDLKALHKYITPDILPKELEGKRGPVSEDIKKSIDVILNHEKYFTQMYKYGYCEKPYINE